MSERAVPFHCPYCGDEDLRPHTDQHGTWECHACRRAFSLRLIGQLAPPASGGPASEGPASDVGGSR